MNETVRPNEETRPGEAEEQEAIDRALLQMEILYISRCVRPPFGTNVTIREIDADKK